MENSSENLGVLFFAKLLDQPFIYQLVTLLKFLSVHGCLKLEVIIDSYQNYRLSDVYFELVFFYQFCSDVFERFVMIND